MDVIIDQSCSCNSFQIYWERTLWPAGLLPRDKSPPQWETVWFQKIQINKISINRFYEWVYQRGRCLWTVVGTFAYLCKAWTVLIQTSFFKKLSALAIKEAVLAGIISYTTWAADVKWQIIEHGLLIKSHQSSQLNNRSRVGFHKDQFRIKIVTKHKLVGLLLLRHILYR